MQRRTSSRVLASSLLLGALLATAAALGQPTSTDKAAADALFKEGRALLAQGKAAEACPKFEESQRYDPSSSTMFNLGDCYEMLGKTASAFGAFGEAERIARQRAEVRRIEVAAARRQAAEAKLSKLLVRVSGPDEPGLVVVVNGKPLGQGSWGSALPVDPGEHVIEASAPGKRAWKEAIRVGPGPTTVEVAVPALAPVGSPPTAAAPGWSMQRKIGVGVGAAGIAALAAGAGLGGAAVVKNDASLAACSAADPRLCDETGFALRNQAGILADASTVTLGVGAALAAAGVVLFVTAPSARSEQARTSALVAPWFSPGGSGFIVRVEH